MADEFAYRLQSSPEGRLDGSGQVGHDVYAVYREEGTSDPWVILPGHHKTFLLPADEISTVMDMPDDTGPQRSAKNQAYKELMRIHKNDAPDPLYTNWDEDEFQDYVDQNNDSVLEAGRVNDYITVTLSQTYPVEFNL